MCLFFLVTISLNLIFVAWSWDCAPQKVEKCVEDLNRGTQNENGPIIVKNEQHLNEVCGYIDKSISCIQDFVDHCVPVSQLGIFSNLTMASREFASDYCKEGSSTRKEYIKHLDCYNYVTDEVYECMRELLEVQTQIVRGTVKHEDIGSKLCCYYGNAFNCSRTVVRSCCSSDAAALYDQMEHKATSQLLQVLSCDRYMYSANPPSACSAVPAPKAGVCQEKFASIVANSASPLFFSFLNTGTLLISIFNIYRKCW